MLLKTEREKKQFVIFKNIIYYRRSQFLNERRALKRGNTVRVPNTFTLKNSQEWIRLEG